MRPLVLLSAFATLAACTPQGVARPPPSQSLHYPTGIVHVGDAGAEGLVYVANSNFDRRFDYGSVVGIDLARLPGLPAFGAPVPESGPAAITDLRLAADSQVLVQSFTGEMVGFRLPDGATRLFTPSRDEGNYLHVVDARGASLSCPFPGPSDRDCSSGSPSLTALENVGDGKPRAPEPIGVGLSNDGQLWVTHIRGADSPVGSARNIEAYVVALDAANPVVGAGNFIQLGTGGSNSVAVGSRYAFLTGRFLNPRGYLLRLVDRTGKVALINPGLENVFQVLEARGIALSSDERRAYIAGRAPDSLLVVDVQGATTDFPRLSLVRSVPLPDGASAVRLIERPGRGPVVVVTCSLSGTVAIYDDDIGQVVAQVTDVGSQPFGVDVQRRGNGARLYVTTFGDGRVGVLDMPDLNVPQTVRVVARLGLPQFCLVDQSNPACATTTP